MADLMQRLAPPGPNLVSSKTPRSAPHTTAISETVAFSTTSILSASPVLKDGLLESAGSRKPEAGCVHLASCSRQSGRKPILLSPALRWKWGWAREGGILPSAPQRCHGLEDARELKEDWAEKVFSTRGSCVSVPPRRVQRTFHHH